MFTDIITLQKLQCHCQWYSPSLGWLATTKLALWRSKWTSIVTVIAITSGKSSPVSSDTLAIDPYLTFTHSLHVQCQWFVSFGSIKRSLQSLQIKLISFEASVTFSELSLFCLWVYTLCHVNGWFLCTTIADCIHATVEIPFGEARSMDSPFNPTCLKAC